jgi:acyl carrier protein
MSDGKMGNEEVKEKLIHVLQEYMDPSVRNKEISMDIGLDDLGLDSFKAIYLLLDIEEAFGVQIPDSMLSPEIFASPSSLQQAIQSLLGN